MTQTTMDAAAQAAVQAFHMAAHRRHYPKHHTVLHEGDAPDALYMILEGSVSIIHEDADGREMVLAYLGPGDIFGEMCLFPELEARSALARTRTATVVSELGYQPFRDLSDKHPELMYVVACQMAKRLRDTTRRAVDLAFVDVAGRIARTLLDLADSAEHEDSEEGRVVRISRQELARIVGCSREMAGRVLKVFEEDDVVSVKGRAITIRDDAGLGATIGT